MEKRKKRRTRKYLDDIRKRSLRNTFCDLISDVSSKQTKPKANYTESRPKNVFITSKRLTLNRSGFSKAVTSETITRPLVSAAPQADIKNSVVNVLETTKGHLKMNGEEAETLGDPCTYDEFQTEGVNDRENVSPESLVMLSPAGAPSTSASAASASSRNSAQGSGSGYRLYAQFLKEVPFHIERNSPLLINKNVMKKTKTFLQNVYTEGFRRESENNILHCMTNKTDLNTGKNRNRIETPQSIIQNPMDYIKMGVLRKSNKQPEDSPTSSPTPSSQTASPLAVIQDTPDYTYYPRKN